MTLQKFDDLWFRTALSEQTESRVIQHLKKNHPEYQEMRTQAANLVEQCPALEQLFDCEKGVTLTAEEHTKLHEYFQLISGVESLERAYHFFIGQTMAFFYDGKKEAKGTGKGLFYCPFGVLDFQELNIGCLCYIHFFSFYAIVACKPRMRT